MIKWQNSNKVFLKPSVSHECFSSALNTGAAGFCEKLVFVCRKLNRRVLQDRIFSLDLTSLLRQEQGEMISRVC
jgi:hypothetical protein